MQIVGFCILKVSKHSLVRSDVFPTPESPTTAISMATSVGIASWKIFKTISECHEVLSGFNANVLRLSWKQSCPMTIQKIRLLCYCIGPAGILRWNSRIEMAPQIEKGKSLPMSYATFHVRRHYMCQQEVIASMSNNFFQNECESK